MCSKLKVFSAILLLSLAIFTQPTSALLADEIVKAAVATTVQAKLNILQTAWTAINNVQPLDASLTVTLHRGINAQLILNPLNLPVTLAQRRYIDRFYEEVRDAMIWAYGRTLAQVLNINNKLDLNVEYVQSFVAAFEYDPGTALKIFTHAISELYGIKNLAELAQYLDVTSYANPKAWELKIDSQLYLYFKYLHRADVDNEYLLVVSYYFQAYKYYSAYPLSAERMQRLDKAIASLPPTLKTLYFPVAPVCTKNAAFNEYLFEKIDLTNAAKPDIFTRPNQNFMTNVGHWVVIPQAELDTRGFLVFKATLQNLPSSHYLYRDVAGGNKIVASTAVGAPATGVWNLSVRNNNLVFSQSGFLLCSTTALGLDWRSVYAFQLPSITAPAACQWELVGKCPAA